MNGAASRIRRVAYRFFRKVAELHEEYHVVIELTEVAVALLGTIRLGLEFYNEPALRTMASPELVEFMLFLILTLLLSARLATSLRALDLGPKFRNLTRRNPAAGQLETGAKLVSQLMAMKSGSGLAGGPLVGSHKDVTEAIKALARESSTLFSMKTYGEPDMFWERWEFHYLSEWHEVVPDAIWRIAGKAQPENQCAGYFSVVVPVDARSYSALRKGHLHTALAPALDFAHPPPDFLKTDFHLLIYTAQFVGPEDSAEEWDRPTLIYGTLEHIAHLIRAYAPDLLAAKPARGFKLVCESSNGTQDDILTSLGFSLLKETHGEGKAKPRPLKSPAGFKLFEFSCGEAALAARTAEQLPDLIMTIAGVSRPIPTPEAKPILVPQKTG